MSHADTPTPCNGRPEAVAALVDGRLSTDEQAELEIHLADCELCLELLAETTALVHPVEADEDADLEQSSPANIAPMPAEDEATEDEDEAGQILPFAPQGPRKNGRSFHRSWIGLVAASLLVAVLFPILRPTGFSTQELVVAATSVDNVSESLAKAIEAPIGSTDRGPDTVAPEHLAALRLGIERVRLQVAVDLGLTRAAQDRATLLLDQARDLSGASPELIQAADAVYLHFDGGENVSSLGKKPRQLDQAMAKLPDDPRHWANLGRFLESGRLLAGSGAPLRSEARQELLKDLEAFLASQPMPEAWDLGRQAEESGDVEAVKSHYDDVVDYFFPPKIL